MDPKRFIVTCVLLWVCALGGGCEKLFQKDSERTVAAADKKAAAGDYRMAIKLYEASMDGTARTADLHYKLALIYDEKLKDPLNALHHFNRYLDLDPSGKHSKEAKAYQKDGALRLAEVLSKGSIVTQEEAIRIKKENLDLRMQVVALRDQRNAPASAAGKGDGVQKAAPPGSRTYVVQPGDTMALIAQKFYKNKNRWKDIQDANFSGGGTAKIKPGQTLVIPK